MENNWGVIGLLDGIGDLEKKLLIDIFESACKTIKENKELDSRIAIFTFPIIRSIFDSGVMDLDTTDLINKLSYEIKGLDFDEMFGLSFYDAEYCLDFAERYIKNKNMNKIINLK